MPILGEALKRLRFRFGYVSVLVFKKKQKKKIGQSGWNDYVLVPILQFEVNTLASEDEALISKLWLAYFLRFVHVLRHQQSV